MKMIKKTEALDIVQRSDLPVTFHNTVFSNINSGPCVWWLVPKNDKFDADFYIILNNSIISTLYIFYIPAETFPTPRNTFYQRNDKDCSHIEIRVGDDLFTDIKSEINFLEYFLDKVTY